MTCPDPAGTFGVSTDTTEKCLDCSRWDACHEAHRKNWEHVG